MTIEDRQELVTKNRDMVTAATRHAMNQYRLPEDMRDELSAAASLGLVQAAARFDPKQDTKFTTFAYPRVRGAILDALRPHARNYNHELLDDLLDPASPLSGPEEIVLHHELSDLVAELPKNERQVVEALYFDDKRLTELDGVSASWACRLHDRALERLRNELER